MDHAVITQRIENLKKRRKELEDLLSTDLSDPSLVYVGDGYFVNMTPEDAKSFLERKLGKVSEELGALSQLAGVNEDGLPVMEIVEELDENDNVVNSQVSRSGMSSLPPNVVTSSTNSSPGLSVNSEEDKSSSSRGKVPSSKSDSKTQKEDEKQSKPEKDENKVPRITELDDNETAKDAVNEPGVTGESKYINEISRNNAHTDKLDDDLPSAEFRDIDPKDVLELELLEEDEDDDNVNFDFDDLEEEEDVADAEDFDDDLNDDSDHFGWEGGSLFPQNEATRRLIAAHLNRLVAADSHTKEESGKKPKDSRVRFAEDVDVKEFETSSSERKSVLPTRKLSRFKITRHAAQSIKEKNLSPPKSNRTLSLGSNTKSSNGSAMAAAAAAAVARHPSTGPVQHAITERIEPARSPMKLQKPRTLHKAKGKPTTDTHQTSGHHVATHAVSPSKQSKGATAGEQEVAAGHPSSSVPEQAIVETPSRKDADTLSSTAESIFNDSFIPDDKFLELHDKPDEAPTDADITSKPAEPQNRPLLSSVQERPTNEELEGQDADELEEDDNSVNMAEIKQEYQRLRQKLIYQSGGFKLQDKDREVEPVSADGSSKKVSRFKAARIG